MKKIALLLLLTIIWSCGSSKSKQVVTTKKERTTKTKQASTTKQTSTKQSSTKPKTSSGSYTSPKTSSTTDNIIKTAKSFKGVKYKYGGTTKKGMDCSGLIQTSFLKEDIKMPRTTSALSTHGDWIDLKKVQKGDLLFFATKKGSRKINHVGLVTSARTGRVEFIHASSSKGVMTSLLSERYWYVAFVQARRVL
ncbi:C40 family peptidase [Olleya sp. R77988]|uniref:C40 family peptidase n=1 Tax=Olleya sp. R77988 TaxID=3093875 RepID=UPI0037C80780